MSQRAKSVQDEIIGFKKQQHNLYRQSAAVTEGSGVECVDLILMQLMVDFSWPKLKWGQPFPRPEILPPVSYS